MDGGSRQQINNETVDVKYTLDVSYQMGLIGSRDLMDT